MDRLNKAHTDTQVYVLMVKIVLAAAMAVASFMSGYSVASGHYQAVIAGMEAEWAKDNEAAARMQVELVAAQAKLNARGGK